MNSWEALIDAIDDFGPSIEEEIDALPEGLAKLLSDQELYNVVTWQEYHEPMSDRTTASSLEDACVAGSAVRGLFASHRVLLDIDIPATLEPAAFGNKAKLSFQLPEEVRALEKSMVSHRVHALAQSTGRLGLGGVTTAFDGERRAELLTVWVDADKVWLIPSSTPGHSHLYLDKMMIWEDYVYLFESLRDLLILEPGYVSASLSRGQTMLRLPWVKKTPPTTDAPDVAF